ncbi:MAG: hypothetical protein ABMB14_00875 [Myxococcota bacterium]
MTPYRILVTPTPSELSRELVRGHLYLSVATERDGGLAPLTALEVEASGLPPDDLFGLAMSALRRTTSKADLRPVDTLPGLQFLVAGDGLAASRMVILPELLGPVALGGAVVAVPAPDQLLCVPLSSARALDTLQVLASALGHALDATDHPLSDQLFWYDGARWVPLAVIHGDEEVTVLPTPGFVRTMNRLAAIDLVTVTGEA